MPNDPALKMGQLELLLDGLFYSTEVYVLPPDNTEIDAYCDDCDFETEMEPFVDLIRYSGDSATHAVQIYRCDLCGELVAYMYEMYSISSTEVDKPNTEV